MPYKQDDKGIWWYINSRQRSRAHTSTCDECGKEFHRWRIEKNKPKYCSRACSNKATARKHSVTRVGIGNPGWKGGRKKVGNGYIKIYSPDHPYADKKHCVFEHRLVMEKKIGRYLLPTETVHHKNGIRDDNRPKNLQLFVSAHKSGQLPKDLVKWAKEIIKEYDSPKFLK